jgi:hypothetical protein
MPNVVILSVIMLSVVAPFQQKQREKDLLIFQIKIS